MRRMMSISEGMMMVMLFVDDEDGTSPHASDDVNFPRRRPRRSRFCPPEKKRNFTSPAVSKNYVKIRASVFPRYGGLIKGGEEATLEGRVRPHHVVRNLGRMVGPILALAWHLASPLR
jgi:hypothetical protein